MLALQCGQVLSCRLYLCEWQSRGSVQSRLILHGGFRNCLGVLALQCGQVLSCRLYHCEWQSRGRVQRRHVLHGGFRKFLGMLALPCWQILPCRLRHDSRIWALQCRKFLYWLCPTSLVHCLSAWVIHGAWAGQLHNQCITPAAEHLSLKLEKSFQHPKHWLCRRAHHRPSTRQHHVFVRVSIHRFRVGVHAVVE